MDKFTMELARLDALLRWWGAPGAGGETLSQSDRNHFETLVSDLKQAVAEMTERHEQALVQSKDLLVQSLPAFMNGRDLNGALAAQSKILMSLFDSASTEVKAWVDLTNKVRNAQLALAASNLEALDHHLARQDDDDAEQASERRDARSG
jgi:hypothetical protein